MTPGVRSTSPPLWDARRSSRFTVRDLKLLSNSSPSSPLRVVTLIDFDCFYAQCEGVRLGLSPDHPLGVQQFKHVIAMNYAARARGLKKVQSAEEAKRMCPEIVLQHVPTWREGDTTWRYRDDSLEHMDVEKASLDYYRLKSRQAMDVLKEVLSSTVDKIERAGIDETYVDLSAQVYELLIERHPELSLCDELASDTLLPHPLSTRHDWSESVIEESRAESEDGGQPTSDNLEWSEDQDEEQFDWDDRTLQLGCEIVRDIRRKVLSDLKYTCSAGIARNKVVAKLAAGHNKPNKQTVIRDGAVASFLAHYKFTSMRGLGGKLGKEIVQKFNYEHVADLRQVPLSDLKSHFSASTAQWLYNLIRGIDTSEVVSRTLVKSVLSAKTFMKSITSMEQAEKWLFIFAADIIGRLGDLGPRRPRTIATHLQVHGPRSPARSKQGAIPLGAKLDIDCLLGLSRQQLLELSKEGPTWPCVTLSVSVSDLFDLDTKSRSLKSMLQTQRSLPSASLPTRPASNDAQTTQSPKQDLKRTLLDFSGFGHSDLAKHPKVKRARTASLLPPYDLTSESPQHGTYECPNCTETIAEEHVLEHLDWHAAMNLQNDHS